MENKKAVQLHKKPLATTKIIFLFLASCIWYVGCNKRDAYKSEIEKPSTEKFYQRNENLAEVFKNNNGIRADNLFLNNVMEGLRTKDVSNRLSNSVTKQLGIPKWDFSIILKNSNGFKAMATPMLNDKNEVTGIMLFSQENVNSIRYKILNRLNPQKRLPKYGNKEATLFTKSSLNGLYKLFDAQINQVQEKLKNNKLITVNDLKASTVLVNYICWNYEWSYTDPSTGGLTVGRSLTQCMYSVTVLASSNEGTLAMLEPDGSQFPDGGSGGGGGTGEFDMFTNLYTPNDTIIAHLDSFPCAQVALKKMYDINAQVSELFKNIFGVIATFKLTVRIDNNMDSTLAGDYHTIDGAYDKYIGEINLNPKYLNGSQDYISATIIHESIHAYISYLKMRYDVDKDSSTFNLLFPVFAENYVQRQHNEMGENYVNLMSMYLRTMNSDLDTASANALAWGGLEKTKLYQTFSQNRKISIQNINYEAATLTSTSNIHNFKKCK